MESIDKLPLQAIKIRQIEPKDNAPLAKLIRTTLEEFGANHPGTVYYDDATDHLYEVFHPESKAVYFIAEAGGQVVGGGGIFPSDGLPEDTCELVKMYLYPQARHIGLGKQIIQKCIDAARDLGFKRIYIESMPELKQALRTYEKFGWHYISQPMGNTGHHGCDLWMIKSIEV
jgi:putative acetyltransferase